MGAAAPPARPLRVAGYRYAVALLAPPEPCRRGRRHSRSPSLTRRVRCWRTTRWPSPSGNRAARTGDRTPIWVECTVPAGPVEGGSSYLGALRGRVIHTVTRLMPTLAGKPLLVASPHDGLPPEVPGSPAGKPQAGPPALPPPVFAPAAPRALDVIALPHASGLKRLYLAGRANLPGLGLEGELVSGWGVAHLISGGQTRRHPGQRRRLIALGYRRRQ